MRNFVSITLLSGEGVCGWDTLPQMKESRVFIQTNEWRNIALESLIFLHCFKVKDLSLYLHKTQEEPAQSRHPCINHLNY